MSKLDRILIHEKHRVDIRLFFSNDDFIKKSKNNFIEHAGKTEKNNEHLVLSENKYTHFYKIFFPTEDPDIYIGCVKRCEIIGVYKKNIGYSISLPEGQFENWRSYKNKVIEFIDTAQEK